MTDSRLIVDEDTWKHLPEENRTWIMYKTIIHLITRLEAVENKSFFNKALAFLGGVFGGIAAAFGSKVMH